MNLFTGHAPAFEREDGRHWVMTTGVKVGVLCEFQFANTCEHHVLPGFRRPLLLPHSWARFGNKVASLVFRQMLKHTSQVYTEGFMHWIQGLPNGCKRSWTQPCLA